VEKGIAQGRRPELVGGGLIRSASGWSAIKAMRRAKDHIKSDERILCGGEFVQSVLDLAKEQVEERHRLQSQGYDLDKVTSRISSVVGIDPEAGVESRKTTPHRQSTRPVVLLGGKKAGFQCHGTLPKAGCLPAIGEYFCETWREDHQIRAVKVCRGIERYNSMACPSAPLAQVFAACCNRPCI